MYVHRFPHAVLPHGNLSCLHNLTTFTSLPIQLLFHNWSLTHSLPSDSNSGWGLPSPTGLCLGSYHRYYQMVLKSFSVTLEAANNILFGWLEFMQILRSTTGMERWWSCTLKIKNWLMPLSTGMLLLGVLVLVAAVVVGCLCARMSVYVLAHVCLCVCVWYWDEV